MELKNKIIVVTGGTSGIGLSIVKKLLSSCDVKYVAIFELDLPVCHSVFNDLQKDYGERIGFYSCDVTKTSLISENLDRIIASHGTVDILVNNAGICDESKPEDIIDINLKAVVMSTLMLVDRIGKHKGGNGGLVVNIASIMGFMNIAVPAYSASKHGVVSFTRTMKDAYKMSGVSVVAVCPGMTATPLLTKGGGVSELFQEKVQEFMDTFPTQMPENVAAAVVNIIQNGEPGDVWISENDETPYSVKSVDDYKSLKIKEYPA